jgi:hypothetical protein
MNDKLEDKVKKLFSVELDSLSGLQVSAEKWRKLERLHIIGQLILPLHFKVHFLMLNLAFQERKGSEILGQILRIVLVIPGHMIGRLPIGNVGTSRVSAFKTMPIPDDMRAFLDGNKKKNSGE